MELAGEEAAGEIADDARLDVGGVEAGGGERGAGDFHDEVAQRLAFLFEVAFEVGAGAAEEINGCVMGRSESNGMSTVEERGIVTQRHGDTETGRGKKGEEEAKGEG